MFLKMVAGLDSGFVCVCRGSVLRTLPPHTVAAMTKHCTSLQVRTRPSPYSCLMLDPLRCDLLCVSFHAAPSSRTQKQKAIKSDPGGKTLRFVGGALPHSGSESGLMALNACLVSTPCASSIANKCHGVSRGVKTFTPSTGGCALSVGEGGAPGRNRTHDLRFTRPLLCH